MDSATSARSVDCGFRHSASISCSRTSAREAPGRLQAEHARGCANLYIDRIVDLCNLSKNVDPLADVCKLPHITDPIEKLGTRRVIRVASIAVNGLQGPFP